MTITKDEEIKKRGYRLNPEIIVPTSDLMKNIDEISYLDSINQKFTIKIIPKEEALSNSRSFLTSNFRIHQVLSATPVLNSNQLYISPKTPFELPIIEKESEDVFEGSVVEFFPNVAEKLVLFKGIVLRTPYTEQTSISYTHEIVHTQLDKSIGSINEYYNAEVLSIFLELVHSLSFNDNEKILRLNDSHRVFEMLYAIEALLSLPKSSRDELLEKSKYLSSNLKAYNLFITYYYGSNKLRKEILRQIQTVFDENKTLEDILDIYEITYESSQDTKRLKKYFNRG